MPRKRETTTITLDRESFDEAYRDLFNGLAIFSGKPKGELFARAVHLLSEEMYGKRSTAGSLAACRSGLKFRDAIKSLDLP